MALASERRARLASVRLPLADVRRQAVDSPPVIPIQLSEDGFDVIAEVKRRSPGDNGNDPRVGDPGLPARLATIYSQAGAAAVSVLTEPLAFGGGLSDLRDVANRLRDSASGPPVMRKDFLVHPYQVHEARAAGADGILLIADMLPSSAIEAMIDAVEEAGLWVLVEAFEDELFERAADIARDAASRGLTALVGVNSRDLRSLSVDPDRFDRLSSRLPADIPAVAESGLRSEDQAAAAARLGYRLALGGTALVSADDATSLLSGMIQRGRSAAAAR
jgi:indole-3-glycerol phosphate synthase